MNKKPKLQYFSSLNKGLMAICLFFIIGHSVYSQDIITLKNGDILTVKTIEINETEIKYKEMNNLDGPLRVIYKSDAFSIKYENGTKTVFNTVFANQSENNKSGAVDTKFEKDSSDFANVKQKKFGGPRVGLTYITVGTSEAYLTSKNKHPLITQFGWQFETRLFSIEGGPSGIVEFVPSIGGIEQGLFIPSTSFLIGLRSGGNRTFEFALGPNFAIIPDYFKNFKFSTGLVIALGTSFKKGNVNFPLNIAFVPSVGSIENVYDPNTYTTSKKKFETGARISLIVGFNSRNK